MRTDQQRLNTCLQRRMDDWGETRIVIRGNLVQAALGFRLLV
jgi:hypothetical protein